jgi:FixJ family two-component response regulator
VKLQQVSLISIVDDDESAREAAKRLVRSLGYNAVTFGSAEEFLESAQVMVTARA